MIGVKMPLWLSTKNVVLMTLISGILSAMFWQLSTNLTSYNNRAINLIVGVINSKSHARPDLTICPSLEFNPEKLKNIGLDITNNYTSNVIENYENLNGLRMNMTGRELIEQAGWLLGELIERVDFGSFVDSIPIDRKHSKYWKKSYMFGSSCYTLFLPSFYLNPDFIRITARREFGLSRCYWFEGNSYRFYESTRDCVKVKKFCNGNCLWEQLLHKNQLNIILHRTSIMKYNLQFNSVPERFSQQTYVILEEYHVNHMDYLRTTKDFEGCLKDCITKALYETRNCSILQPSTFDQTIDSYCNFRNIDTFKIDKFYIQFGCDQKCGYQKRGQYWKATKFLKAHYNFHIIYKPIIRFFIEIPTYPTGKLLSDIGSNSGLFIGASLFWFFKYLDFIFELIQRKYKDFRYVGTIKNLLSLIVVLTLLMFMVVHTLSTIIQYILQGKHLYLFLDEVDCVIMPNHCNVENHLKKWTIAVLAKEQLHCKVVPFTLYEDCLINCMIKQLLEDNSRLSFYLMGGLVENCTNKDVKWNEMASYIIPNYIDVLFKEVNIDKCKIFCDDTERDKFNFTTHVIPQIKEFYPMSFLSLIFNLGGIMSLYFGFSVLDLSTMVQMIIRRSLNTRTFQKIKSMIKSAVMIFSVSTCGLAILCQLITLFIKNPIITNKESFNINKGSPIVLTVCPWPQSNLTNNIFTSERVVDLLKCEFYDDPIKELQIAVNKDHFLGVCYTCKLIDKNTNKKVIINGEPYVYFEMKKNHNLSDFLYIFVHFSEHYPTWDGQYDHKIPPSTQIAALNINIDSIVSVSKNQFKTSGSYDKCYYECLHKNFKRNYKIFKENMSLNELFTERTTNNCEKECRYLQFIVWGSHFTTNTINYKRLISKSAIKFLKPMIHVQDFKIFFNFYTKSVDFIEEKRLYSISQMTNDLGGIIGFTTGCSFLNIAKRLVNYIFN